MRSSRLIFGLLVYLFLAVVPTPIDWHRRPAALCAWRGLLLPYDLLGSASLGIPRAVIFSHISETYDINRMPFPGPGIVLRFRTLARVCCFRRRQGTDAGTKPSSTD